MKRLLCVAVFVGVVFGTAAMVAAAEQGVAKGAVGAVVPWQNADGLTMFTVTIKGEGVWQAMFSVGPDSREAYALVGQLKPGDRVAIGWVIEANRNWIREIRRDGAVRAEGERGDRERAEGEARREAERKDKEKVEGGDRERAEREAHPEAERKDKEKVEGGDRERTERAEAEVKERRAREERAQVEKREREGRVEGERKEGERKEGERKEVAERGDRERAEGGARREGERAEGEGRREAGREGERREERGGLRLQMSATVATISAGEAVEGRRATLTLKLKPVERGDEVTFTITAEREALYNTICGLELGDKVLAAWTTEGRTPRLQEIKKLGE